ncbi:PAS domain S-box protein [Desulfotomaculum sp. 1211_IL3151]|uniref:PAS domain S-box protein n=1 Tax=Desulfotomaculum sp. 1211_IL3151 TaxID=3084055 RepID=UPI002FD89E23
MADSKTDMVERQQRNVIGDAFYFASVGMAVTAADGRLLSVNPSLCKLLGYTEQELLSMYFQEITYPDDLENNIFFLEKLYRGELDKYELEKRYLHKQGHEVWASINVSGVSDAQGNFLYFIVQIRDISEQKQNEDEIYHFFSLSQDAIATIGLDGYIKRANLTFIKSLGFTKEELMAKPFIFYVHPEDRALTLMQIQNLEKGMEVRDLENRFICKDGSHKWFVWSASSSIRLPVFYAVGRDITASKKMEKEIARSHNRFINILNSIANAFFTLDYQWKFTYLNKVAEQLFMLTHNELLGKSFYSFVAGPVKEQIYEALSRAVAQRMPVHLEIKDFYPGKWIEIHGYPSMEGISVYILDITDRKQMEESIRISEARIRAIFEQSLLGMIIVEEDGRIIEANQAFAKMVGYTKEELCNKGFNDFSHPEDDIKCMLFFNKLVAGQYDHYQMEQRYIRKDGKPVWSHLSVSVIRGDQELPKMFIAFIYDITQSKEMEKEMIRLDRLNLIGKMAAGISHEVRNPLTVVRGFLQMLREKKDCIKYRDYYELMIGELDRANSIITEFLSIGRNKPEEQKMQNLNAIIQTLLPLLQADAMQQDKNIEVKTADVSDLLLNDKEIRQIILNLVRNGLEAMSQGGCITVQTYSVDDVVVLAVKDQGPGIPPEVLGKLGTPFLTTKDKGTGLGLATCFSIAARHNATIDIESDANGTTVYIKFNLLNPAVSILQGNPR